MKPTKAINVTGNPDWKYTPGVKTDVAATIKRAQRAIKERAERDKAAELERIQRRVTPFKRSV